MANDFDNTRGGTQRTVMVNDIDNTKGETQRVIEVNSIDNTKGITKRVYVVGGGGSTPVIDELNVTPSTSAQTITAPTGVDGYSPVNVSAVDNTIDANIVAGNIKKDVQILGVTGSYEGNVPTGTMYIINNGTYNVADKAIANVNVPTTAPALYREFQIDADGMLIPNTTTSHLMDFTGIKDISEYALTDTYYSNTAITGAVNFPDLIKVSKSSACTFAFSYCTGLTSVNAPLLTTVSGNSACQHMFQGCSGITSINLPLLTVITSTSNGCAQMFLSCSALTNVVLPSLTGLTGTGACTQMFAECTNLTSLSFPSVAQNSFGTRINQFTNLCYNVSNITLHFPSNVQTQVEGLSGYSTTAPFGAVAGTVLFDLPATYTLTGADTNTYTRNPKEDTGTALAWKEGAYGTTNFATAYYTSGTSDPTVGATIYSDSACTTAVTTISSIA